MSTVFRTPVPDLRVPSQRDFWNMWHRTKGATGEGPIHLELRELLLRELASLGTSLRILDLGCGQGYDTLAFLRAEHETWAVDFSSEALDRVTNAVRRSGLDRSRLTLMEQDLAEPLPLRSGWFDGVYSQFALHYFPDEVTCRVFAEIHRVTRPGGRFVFTVKSVDDPYYGLGDRLGEHLYCRNGHLRHFFSEAYAKDLLHAWRDVQIETCRGSYASPKESAYLRVVATKPIANTG